MTTAAKTKLNLILHLGGGAIMAVLLADVASAAVPRAFVSTTGSDTNPCSAVQPCRSFNQALTVVEPGGEIVVQDSGGYSTGFTITQSVTIDASAFNASVISTSATDLCTINAGPSDRVILRGISFHGANVGVKGINVTQVGSLYVEHCSFAEFFAQGIQQTIGNLWVTDSIFRSCFEGIIVQSTSTAVRLDVEGSRFSECSTAGVVLNSTGTAAASGMISNCSATLCGGGFGVGSLGSANADLTLINSRATGNNIGLQVSTNSTGNAIARLANCVVTNNNTGINKAPSGGGAASILGTTPGTNLISDNQSGNALGGTVVSLQ